MYQRTPASQSENTFLPDHGMNIDHAYNMRLCVHHTRNHSDGFERSKDPEGSECRDISKVHKLSNVPGERATTYQTTPTTPSHTHHPPKQPTPHIP